MNLVVGVGLRAGTPYRELRDLVAAALAEAGTGTVRYVVTVAGRETEPGLQRLTASLGAELQTVAPEELAAPTGADAEPGGRATNRHPQRRGGGRPCNRSRARGHQAPLRTGDSSCRSTAGSAAGSGLPG